MSDPSATPRVETVEAMREQDRIDESYEGRLIGYEAAALVADRLIAAAVREERERLATIVDEVFGWWDEDAATGDVEPYFLNGVKRACLLMRERLETDHAL